MPPVNSMDYSGKDTVLDVVRTEATDFFKIVDDPNNWNVQTRCTEWEVRDMVGHMLDVTEGYLSRWERARKNEERNTAGLLVMADSLNKGAQSFRNLPREEAIQRLEGGLRQNDGYLREVDRRRVEQFHCHASIYGRASHFFLSRVPCDGLWRAHLGYALGSG